MIESTTDNSPLPSENPKPLGAEFFAIAKNLKSVFAQERLTRRQIDLGEELVRRVNDLGDIIDEIRPLVRELFQSEGRDSLLHTMWETLMSSPKFQPKPGHVWRVRQAVAMAEPGTEKLFSEESRSILNKLRRLTEHFYESAHRSLDIFNEFDSLKGIDCLPIRHVRNQLITHPNKKGHSGVTSDTFSWSTVQGPHIKGGRVNGQNGFEDKGLYSNAERLVDTLNEAVTRLRTKNSIVNNNDS